MEYFAALEPDRLAKELVARKDAFYQWVLMTGRLARWRTAFDTYYGNRGTHKSYGVTPAGEQGELSFLMSNEFRNLVQHLVVLTTQSRIALECAAINSDMKSLAQSKLGNGLLEYYFRQGKVERYMKHALEISLIMDTGWVFTPWDTTLGQELAVDPENGQIVTDGDIRPRAKAPIDVPIDFARTDPEENDWVMVRDSVNKFDLAAQYPEKADQIVRVQRDRTQDALFRFGDVAPYGNESAEIDIWTFHHRRSPAMPRGRMFQYLNGDVWLFDGPMPYRRIPGTRLCPTEMILSAFGYSNANDLLSLQDCIDALISAAVTNMTTCGVNTLWTKDPEDFDFEELAKGMSLVSGETKPEVVQLAHMSPELLPLLNFLISRQEAISGINSVARGNTAGKDLSGAAMALLQSMAIQFNSGLQQAYIQGAEDVGTNIIYAIQDFAQSPRTALIAGQGKKYMLQDFSSAHVEKIQRVFVNVKNPLANTTSGKKTIAEDLLKVPGAIKNADEYLEVLESGCLEPMTEDDLTDLDLIRAENEALVRGETPPVLKTDIHPRHIIGHRRPTGDPQARKDAELVKRCDAHIRWHVEQLSPTDPQTIALLKLLGMEPLPPPLPPGLPGAPAGPGAPGLPPGPPAPGVPAPAAPPHPQGPHSGPGPDVSNPEPAPPPVHMPNAPKNPLSGARWNPETGGMPPG